MINGLTHEQLYPQEYPYMFVASLWPEIADRLAKNKAIEEAAQQEKHQASLHERIQCNYIAIRDVIQRVTVEGVPLCDIDNNTLRMLVVQLIAERAGFNYMNLRGSSCAEVSYIVNDMAFPTS